MQGQKQVYMLFVIIFFLFLFSFYKNVIKRDKELKQRKEVDIRNQISMQLKYEEENNEVEQRNIREFRRRQRLIERMREYEDKCYDIHAIIEKPDKEQNEEPTTFDNEQTTYVKKSTKQEHSVVSGPIIYLFIIILLGSLVKATSDLSKQLRNKSNEDENNRRFSLQEYAKLKHERKISKAPIQRRSTLTTINARSNSFTKSLEEKRYNPPIPEAKVIGMITEPATPAKAATEIATRPAPLLRRCSVPVFAHHSALGIRRPSVESVSEDDSSPDVKRRVRMIHRH